MIRGSSTTSGDYCESDDRECAKKNSSYSLYVHKASLQHEPVAMQYLNATQFLTSAPKHSTKQYIWLRWTNNEESLIRLARVVRKHAFVQLQSYPVVQAGSRFPPTLPHQMTGALLFP
jgi:hypothetical protein